MDTVRLVTILALCGLSAECHAAWWLNTSIPSATTNLALLSGNTFEKSSLLTDTNGDVHVLMFYDVSLNATGPVQVFDANVTQGTGRLTNATGASGRIIAYGEVYTNGWYYRGTSDDGGKSYAFRYHPQSGEMQLLHQGDAKTLYSTCISDDGRIVWGNFGKAGVEIYNPTNGAWINYGPSDTNYTGAAHYAYTIGADSRYVYVGVGQSPWYLAVVDTQTSNHWTYYSNLNLSTSTVQRGADGMLYYSTPGQMYQLLNGAPVATNSVDLVAWYLTNYNVRVDDSVFTANTGKDFDFGFAYPDSSNNVASLRWASTGSNDWTTVTVSNFNLAAANPSKVYANGDGNIFVISQGYLPLLRYSPSSQHVTIIGRTGSSLYDAVWSTPYWYISGYADVTYRYDTGSAWNLTASTADKHTAGVNARQLTGGWGKYHYYSCFGSDGYLYIGAHHERDSVGGDIGWYDVSTLASVGNLRNPFTATADDVSELIPAISGTKLVYLSTGNNNLFVVDVATKSTTKTNSSILPELSTLEKCVETSSGIVVGVSGNRVWKYDVGSDTVLYTNSLPGTAWSGFTHGYDKRLTLGPDGYVWVTLGNDLYRIDPSTCSPSLVKSGVGSWNVTFNGGDAYLYSASSPQLNYLPALLTNSLSTGTATIGTAHFY